MQVAAKGRFGPSLELCVTKPTSRRIIKFGRDCILHQVYFVLCCIFRCIFSLATFLFALYFVFTVFCVSLYFVFRCILHQQTGSQSAGFITSETETGPFLVLTAGKSVGALARDWWGGGVEVFEHKA